MFLSCTISAPAISTFLAQPPEWFWLKRSKKVCFKHSTRRRSKLWWASFYTRLIPTKGSSSTGVWQHQGVATRTLKWQKNVANLYSSNFTPGYNSTIICRAATIQDTCYAHGAQQGTRMPQHWSKKHHQSGTNRKINHHNRTSVCEGKASSLWP